MPHTVRPRRSMLYVPGSNARALVKAASLACDGVIIDLEDAVAPTSKESARAAAVAACGRYDGREVLIRVNGLETPWGDADVAAVARTSAHGLVLPKVESPTALREADELMRAAGAPESMRLWAMIETPRGVLASAQIAGTRRLAGLIMGTSDLTKDLRARHTPDRIALVAALSQCVLVARAHGLAILDGVQLDLGDEAQFRANCEQGRDLGFDGKTLIHPKTIAIANAAFGPTADEIAHAEAVVTAHAAAMVDGNAVAVVNGRLVEALHVNEAKRVLAYADAVDRLAYALALHRGH